MKNILFLIVLFGLLGCQKEKKPPHFIITNQTWVTTSFGSPALRVTVMNDGEMTGYNLGVDVTAKQGNTIIEVAHAYPGDLGDIKPGESAVDEATFFSTTASQLSTCTVNSTYTWLNREY